MDKKITLSLQLFTLLNEFVNTPEEAVKTAAEIGYDAVELFAFDGMPSAKDMHLWLDRYGIELSGNNVGWDHISKDNINRTFDYMLEAGSKRIAIGSAPVEQLGKRKYLESIFDTLMFAYEKAKENGFEIGYHSHYTDQIMLDGVSMFDRIFSKMPEDFYMILDTGNTEAGGGNSVHYLNKYAGRTPWIHLKPYHQLFGSATMIGEDSYDWAELTRLAVEKGGADTFVIEYSYRKDRTNIENAKLCFERIKQFI